MNKHRSSRKRHEENEGLHKGCPVTCPGKRILEDAKRRKQTKARETGTQTVRLLFVIRAIATPTKSAKEAGEKIEMFPVAYEHITNPYGGSVIIQDTDNENEKMRKIERKSLQELKDLAKECCFDDKKKKLLYVEEWVSIYYTIVGEEQLTKLNS